MPLNWGYVVGGNQINTNLYFYFSNIFFKSGFEYTLSLSSGHSSISVIIFLLLRYETRPWSLGFETELDFIPLNNYTFLSLAIIEEYWFFETVEFVIVDSI